MEKAKHAHPNYIGIFFFLAALTAVELGVAFLPWPKMVLILLLIFLAIWKAALVALYYMHLRYEPNRLRLLAIAPLPLAVILVVAVTREFRW
ncbi:MAG TPA: cytochrome C oxidase subunit IV family protein [Gemmatimonadaceae bacterium]|jgi:cytochrome c oxidase subunit 4|nr:cytochrome C oxidase subunit IV family protein [Gemmatimonadaceae bacterium]